MNTPARVQETGVVWRRNNRGSLLWDTICGDTHMTVSFIPLRAHLGGRVVIIATLLAAVPAGAAAQPTGVPPVPVIYSSVPMTRNADLTFAAAVLAPSGIDAVIERVRPGLLRENGSRGRIARAVKLVAFDLPVVHYFVGLNHELGHISRAHEQGFAVDLKLVGTPWSSRAYELWASDPAVFADLGSQAGGLEGSQRLKELSESWIRRSDRVTPAHALATIVASLDLPVYAFWNLAPEVFDTYLSGRGRFPDGDVGRFVAELVERRAPAGGADFETVRRQVRFRSALSLLDVGLWTLTSGVLLDHMWNGEQDVPVRWLSLGSVGIIPSVRYELTPIGPEYHIRSQYRMTGHTGVGYVRWTERIAGQRQVGAGFSMSPRSFGSLRPHADVDLWSDSSGRRGVHAGLLTELADWPSARAALNLSLGAKSSGYVAGYPLDAGGYVGAGFTVRLW